jgi:hypothetical protein
MALLYSGEMPYDEKREYGRVGREDGDRDNYSSKRVRLGGETGREG